MRRRDPIPGVPWRAIAPASMGLGRRFVRRRHRHLDRVQFLLEGKTIVPGAGSENVLVRPLRGWLRCSTPALSGL